MDYTNVYVKALLQSEDEWIGKKVTINGYANAVRVQGANEDGVASFGFASVMDSSTVKHVQVIMNLEKCKSEEEKQSIINALKKIKKGSLLTAKGTIVACPEGNNKEQKTELSAEFVEVYGNVDSETYPMSKHKVPLETIREHPHLRFKTKAMMSVNIVRNTASRFIHQFFQERGFQWAHTPLLTSNDCEGAGEIFTIKSQHDEATEAKKKDFFGKKVNLSVSGQLHGEAFVHGLQKIYTFGPTFRADPSKTSRHLAEFWMIEPEVGPITFDELIDLEVQFIKYVVYGVMESCPDEIKYLESTQNNDLTKTLNTIVHEDFARVSYTEAIKILEEAIKSYKIKVVSPNASEKELRKMAKKAYLITEAPYWGMDLKSEHERYITDIVYQKPVVIYHYPKSLKPFYMKPTKSIKYVEGETVDAMDVLIPHLGELIGGSMREDEYEPLKECMIKQGILEELEWYLDLRKYGSFPHGGFGLGFERLVMLLTGMKSIKDTIAFPRYSGHCFA